ncbi:MAG: UDP binding domain-containing protein [SAR324 cluster bacterium]|nr:UDP binding domain-containing protein [SAR324 cluster bacterium]
MGENARVRIHDPKALENARIELKNLKGDVSFVEDVYEAAEGAHALALVTQWDEYRDLDYEKIHQTMAEPAFIFDGRNHLDHDKLYKIGFNVFPLGKSPFKHI